MAVRTASVSRSMAAAMILSMVLAAGTAAAWAQTGRAEGTTGAAAVSVTPDRVASGDWVQVEGAGFQGSSLVFVETCSATPQPPGSDQLTGLGCEEQTSVNVPVAAGGAVNTLLHVVAPATGCPCFVRMAGTTGSTVAAAPITVDDQAGELPAALAAASGGEPADAGSTDQLRFVGAALVGSDTWGAWFGAAPTRTLVFTLENTGTTTIVDPPVSLAVGRSSNPATDVAIPALGSIEPGERRRYEVPVTFDAFAVGSYSAVGRITGQDEAATFAVSTSSYPWALIIVPLLVAFEVVLLRGRNRLRRAFHASSTSASASPAAPGEDRAEVEIDALVDAAIAGAFAAGAGGTIREGDTGPRTGSPIDVRPIVSTVVARRVAVGVSGAPQQRDGSTEPPGAVHPEPVPAPGAPHASAVPVGSSPVTPRPGP